jgi:plasmid stability protein
MNAQTAGRIRPRTSPSTCSSERASGWVPGARPVDDDFGPYCLQSASIIHVATLYVREVPERLYKRLRARARRNGRSLNAEVIEILEGTAARDADAATVTRRLAELAKRIDLPVDAPKPEEIIRSERDRR